MQSRRVELARMRWGALRKIKVKLRVTLAPQGNEWFGLASRHGVYKLYEGMTSPIFLKQCLTVRGKALEQAVSQRKLPSQQMQAY